MHMKADVDRMNHSGLARAAVKGSIWSYINFAFGKAVVFVTTIILARILQPEDFGLMAMALVLINFLKRVQNLGVGDALIYYRDQSGTFANTAFLICTITGVFFSALIYFSAPVAAAFYREPKSIPVIHVLSVWFIIINLGSTHESALKKAMDFRKQSVPRIAQAIVKGGCSITLAVIGFGIWSLVWGQMAGELAATLLFWMVIRWRPKLHFSMDAAGFLIGYGSRTILMKFLQGIFRNVDYLIIGRRMDSTQLGFYTIAFRLPDIVIEGIQSAVTPVIFSAYVRVQEDMEILSRGFLKTLKFVSVFSVPVSLGMYIIAPEFVEIFYTNRWAPIIPVIRALSIYAIINSFDSQANLIYRATDRITLANKIGLIKMISAVPVLWVAAGYSILTVAIAQIGLALIIVVIQVITLTSILGLRYADLFRSLIPSLISATVMVSGIWLINIWVNPFPALIRLLVAVTCGCTLYTGTLRVIHPEIFKQLADIFQKRKQT